MPSIELPDVGLSYQREGAGPPIVWVQGVGLGGCAWVPQVNCLRDEFDNLSLDNRGIAPSTGDTKRLTIETMATDLAAVVDHLGIPRFYLVGHSMGGVIAQEFALRYPDRVRSLVLMCTFARSKDAVTPTWAMLKHGIATSIGTADMRRRAFARMVMPAGYIAQRGMARVIDELEATFGRSLAHPPQVVHAQLRALSKHDSTAQLAKLAAIPTLVMSATHDPIALPVYGRRLADAIGTARFLEVPDASHALPVQLPDVVHAELHRHFAAHST